MPTNTTISASERGAYAITLTTNTVDTVTITAGASKVEVTSDGTAALYFTVDGTTPTVAGKGTYELVAGVVGVREVGDEPGILPMPVTGRSRTTVAAVKLISAGATKYSVTAI